MDFHNFSEFTTFDDLILFGISMKKILVFLLVLLVASTSCKKGKATFTLKGVITDATFNGGLSGAQVDLYEVEAGGSPTTLIGSTTLGSSGEYFFSFPRNAAESYILFVHKDSYFEGNFLIPFSELTIEEDNVRNYSLAAESWAALHFVTTNPAATLVYTKQQGKANCDDCCPTTEQTFYGVLDTILYCPNDGNTVYSYNYQVVGTSNFGTKSGTTVAFDTTTITLSY